MNKEKNIIEKKLRYFGIIYYYFLEKIKLFTAYVFKMSTKNCPLKSCGATNLKQRKKRKKIRKRVCQGHLKYQVFCVKVS